MSLGPALVLLAALALHTSPAFALHLRTAFPGARAAARPEPRDVLVAVHAAPIEGTRVRGESELPARLVARAATLGFGASEIARTRRGDGAVTRWLRLRAGDGSLDARAAARLLAAEPGVVASAPDVSLRLALTTPNDPMLAQQWHLTTSSAAIRARNAWDVQRGDSGVVIAILDTGVDRTHPDLAAKIWRNPGEVPGNLVDDDANGYVDDVNGWDFGNDDANPDPEPLIEPTVGIDEGWHGTYCAGLAAAASDNAVGIAGVAWGSRIMPLKVNDSTGDIPLSALTEAVAYAIANDAKVLNMSLGTGDESAQAFFQALMDDAVAGDVACIAAAGNDGTDLAFYPAACESVLAVAATNAQNHRADFSNWGWYVDLAAPGAGMWSTIANNYPYDEVSQIFFEILWGWDTVSPYMGGDGTSFACPVTAGVAALVRSQFPAMTAVETLRHLVLRGDAVTYDNPIGPRLNAFRAVTEPTVDAPPSAAARTLVLSASPNPSTGALRLAFASATGEPASLEIVDAAGRRVRAFPPADARHDRVWDGRDESGAVAPPGLYFAIVRTASARAVARIVRLE